MAEAVFRSLEVQARHQLGWEEASLWVVVKEPPVEVLLTFQLEAALCRCKATKLYWRRCFE